MSYLHTCELCGKEFESRDPRSRFCKGVHTRFCEWCGKEFTIQNPNYPHRTCSVECRRAMRKAHAEETSLELYGVKNAGGTDASKAKTIETCKRKYGVEWPGQADIQKQHASETYAANGGNPMQREECREKAKKTCLERYGATNPLCKDSNIRQYVLDCATAKYGTSDPGNLPEFREKAKRTSQLRYGVDYYTQTDEYKEAVHQTSLEKYGVDHFTQSNVVKEKSRRTSLSRYGVEHPSKSKKVKQKISNTVQERYGVPYFCMHKRCISAQNLQPSKMNIQFATMLGKELNVPVGPGLECDYEFTLKRFSYDVVLRSRKIFFEIDPSYTHTTWPTQLGGKSVNYHQRKSNTAAEFGYKCIHVFEWDDWNDMIDMVKIRTIVPIEDCILKQVSFEELKQFIDNHYYKSAEQLYTNSNSVVGFGFYLDNHLIQVAAFEDVNDNDHTFNLISGCDNAIYSVDNGCECLLDTFVKQYKPSKILASCDNSKFDGSKLTNLGFNIREKGPLNKYWSKGKHVMKDNDDTAKDEKYLIDTGWLPVYDCGVDLYVKEVV